MKKFITSIILALVAVMSLNAQSFQWHQSYPSDDGMPNQKYIADYFWTSANGKFNVFSWNEFQVAKDDFVAGTALLYGEYQLGKSNFYLHEEVRLFTHSNNFYMTGFAYLLPFKNQNLGVYLTPMYAWHGFHDFQFSINSSYDSEKFYYEGFFDSNWIGKEYTLDGLTPVEKTVIAPSCYTEQKFYYKLNEMFQVGTNLAFAASSAGVVFRPYLVLRVQLFSQQY